MGKFLLGVVLGAVYLWLKDLNAKITKSSAQLEELSRGVNKKG